MKHCPKCNKTYNDASLNFCLEDGSALTFFDTEAETLKSTPRKAEMSAQDIQLEIANLLTSSVAPGEKTLIRFEQLTSLGMTIEQISENFEDAAKEVECEVISKTDTRAWVRRNSTENELGIA